MMREKRKLIYGIVMTAIVTMVISITGTYCGVRYAEEKKLAQANKGGYYLENLYQEAMEDAVFIEKEEIEPLVEITPENNLITWNEDHTKVLMATFHKYPDSYVKGQEAVLSWGDVWTFSDKEFGAWYEKNSKSVGDWELRMKQLLGMPAENENTHVSLIWVDPKDMIRPAYETDITKQMKSEFTEADQENESYQQWFDENIISSYFEGAYPWTRLGYTYDWADNGKDYGLSEFLVAQDSVVEVKDTLLLEDYIRTK